MSIVQRCLYLGSQQLSCSVIHRLLSIDHRPSLALLAVFLLAASYFQQGVPRAFWYTRTSARACDTANARHLTGGRKNGASEKPHWEPGVNPST